MKVTAAQKKNLVTIWTKKTAGRLVHAERRNWRTGITKSIAAQVGYTTIHGNAISSLMDKGLVSSLVTKDMFGEFRIAVLVLTPKGREVLGV